MIETSSETYIILEHFADNNEEKESEIGMLSGTNIYLTEEEYVKITEILVKITDENTKKGPNKKKYSYIGGLARTKK